jgi:type III secretion protein R
MSARYVNAFGLLVTRARERRWQICGVVTGLALAIAASQAEPATAFAYAATAAALAVAIVVAGRARDRNGRAVGLVDVRRVGGCALGPGQSVHAIRFDDRVLLVGATATSITVLDTAPVEPPSGGASGPRPHAQRAVALVLVALASAAALTATERVARAAQGESVRQQADLAPSSEPGSGAPPRESPSTKPLDPRAPDGSGGVLPATTGPLVWLAALALAPFAIMTMTSFVKISIVLSILRNALGTPQIPPDPVLAAIALALTAFVMSPVATDVAARVAASGADTSTANGALAAASAGAEPVRAFLHRNTRLEEIALFVEIASRDGRMGDPEALAVLVPAFLTSELRQAFITGFLLYVPFLVVDLVVSNILMSMGMVMVSPATVSLPFKVMVFVLVDGWPMLMKGLALSYR